VGPNTQIRAEFFRLNRDTKDAFLPKPLCLSRRLLAKKAAVGKWGANSVEVIAAGQLGHGCTSTSTSRT
jgi:hypothetical protein